MRIEPVDCTKPEIELLLPDYYTGHLTAEDDEKVRSHLGQCRRCRDALRTMAKISGKHKPLKGSDRSRHFAPQLLSRYYTHPASLDKAIIDQIEEHLKICRECSADLRFLRESDKDFRLLAQVRSEAAKPGNLFRRLVSLLKGKRK